ncbi:MAG: TonB-dependent receptor [Betaproteobacteria bacterium]|nr:TonB-dependent receptor [Betaproteobacteria bacterium]
MFCTLSYNSMDWLDFKTLGRVVMFYSRNTEPFNEEIMNRLASPIFLSLITLAVLFGPGNAYAQALEVITVTAQKRAESLQDIPISMTALSSADLLNSGVNNVTDLRILVPGLSIDNTQTPTIALRGISSSSPLPTGDPAVATHVNGVYLGRPGATRAAFYDLERVEVLRGPQGILYGRNATGGSINIISNKPTFDSANGSIDLQFGNYNRTNVTAVANLPVVEDTLAIRIAGTYDQRDSFVETLGVSNDSYGNAIDEKGVRIQGLYTPTDEFSLLVGYTHYENDGGVAATQPIPPRPGSDPFIQSLNTQPLFSDEQDMVWWEANYDMGWGSVTYLGSWFDGTSSVQNDNDGGPVLPLVLRQTLSGEQLSHEIRLNSEGNEKLDWMIGLYQFEEDTTRAVLADLGPLVINADIPDFNSESRAIFGNVTYHISDDFRLTAGLRYSDDEKTETNSTRSVVARGRAVPPAIGSSAGDWDSTDWQVTAEYNVGDDHLLYAKVGTGYKAGGFVDAISAILTMTTDPTYDTENIFAVEIGHKSEFWDKRVRMNSSLYWYDYEDQQILVFFGGGNIVENANSKISGFETEIQAVPIDNSLINISLAYNDSEFDDGTTLIDGTNRIMGTPQSVDVSGNRLAFTPEWSFNLGARYTFEMGNGATLTPSVNFHWEDDTNLRTFNKTLDVQESWTETDFRLSYKPASDRWYIDGWVKNAEDPKGSDVVNQSIQVSGTGGRTANFRGPRTYGVSFGYRFE